MTDWPLIGAAILMLVSVPAGAWFGSWLHDRDVRAGRITD